MIATVFVTRNGLLEPAGKSQVFGCLRGVSQHYRITLISYEKVEDWADADRVAEVRASCPDLDRFGPAEAERTRPVIGCLGTVLSGWFRLDWLAAFYAVAARQDHVLQFEATTLDDPAQVRAAVDPTGALGARVQIDPAEAGQVPTVLQGQMASVLFFAVERYPNWGALRRGWLKSWAVACPCWPRKAWAMSRGSFEVTGWAWWSTAQSNRRCRPHETRCVPLWPIRACLRGAVGPQRRFFRSTLAQQPLRHCMSRSSVQQRMGGDDGSREVMRR